MLFRLGHIGVEAQTRFANALGDDIGQAHERTAQDEQDVGGVDMDKLLLRMLTATLRRHGSLGTLDDFEQRLLNALARNIARDGQVLGLTGHLVDLVDVDDADLGPLDIEIRGRDQLEQDVLNVLADITCLGEGGCISDGERNLQRTGKRLRKQRFTGTRRSQQHDIGFRKLDIAFLGLLAKADALVVVIHRNGQSPFRGFLPHHMLRQLGVQLMRRGQLREHELGAWRTLLLHMRLDNPVAAGLAHGGHLQTQIAHHGIGAYGGDALVADIQMPFGPEIMAATWCGCLPRNAHTMSSGGPCPRIDRRVSSFIEFIVPIQIWPLQHGT